MREATGSTWTLGLMLGFIMIFVSFITVTISYSKSFRIKNEIISIMEKYGGFNSESATIINNYLKASGYTNKGKCRYDNDLEKIGVSSLDETPDYTYDSNSRYYYCVRKENANSSSTISDVVYEVTIFYKFNLPAISEAATFTVRGKTTDMVDPNDTNANRANKDLFN